MAAAVRARIGGADVTSLRAPASFARARSLSGVRVYDVGQGDAIAVLDQDGQPVLQIDYGGRQGSPLRGMNATGVDARMPVPSDGLVMLTHWDEDHWSTAPKGKAARGANWLVPRQVTSPRAVRFSARLAKAKCIPETRVGRIYAFRTSNGDTLLWQKIRLSSVSPAQDEDCNRSGVAMALVSGPASQGQVILLPGDASFGWVPLYDRLRASGRSLTGLVAFHHGAGTHWVQRSKRLLSGWVQTSGGAMRGRLLLLGGKRLWPSAADAIFRLDADRRRRHPGPAQIREGCDRPAFSLNSLCSTSCRLVIEGATNRMRIRRSPPGAPVPPR